MHARLRPEVSSTRTRALVLLTFVVSVGLGVGARPAHADKLSKTIDKLVQLNKKGMDDLDTAEFESARKAFFTAEELGRKAGLGDHPVMARTYVHLGALALLGYKDKQKASEYFVRAFAMQPDIELDKSLRLGAVGALFTKVQKQKPTPGAAKAPPPSLPPAAAEAKPRQRKGDEENYDGEGAAPSAPPKPVVALNCANPDSTPPEQDLTLRCTPTASEDVVAVSLLYKGDEMKKFETVTMEKSNKGWFQGTVPGKRVQGAAIKFYFEGVDQEGSVVGASGTAEKPHVMAIAEPQKVVVPSKKKAVAGGGRARSSDGEGGEGDGASSSSSADTSSTQWAWWLGAGAGKRGVGGRTSAHKTIGAVRLGGAASFQLAQPDMLGDEYELRWGPWLMAETQLDGLLGEGGVELAATPIKVARLAYALRLGGGYGKDKSGGVPEASATLTIGTRSLVADGGGGGDDDADDDEQGGDDDEDAKPKKRKSKPVKSGGGGNGGATTGNMANGIRGFFTFRNTPPKSGHGLTFLVGVEITPSLFLPPYTKARWMGGE